MTFYLKKNQNTDIDSMFLFFAYLLSKMQHVACYIPMRFLGIRNRHFLTRNQTLRARYTLPFICVLSFISVFMLSHVIPTSKAHISRQISGMRTALLTPDVHQDMPVKMANLTTVTQTEEPAKREHGKSFFFNRKPSNLLIPASYQVKEYNKETEAENLQQEDPLAFTMTIGTGQTVSQELAKAGIASTEAYEIVKALSEHYDPRHVRAGQSFDVELMSPEQLVSDEFKSLSKMVMPVTPAKEIVISRTKTGGFSAQEVEKETHVSLAAQRATLKYSLYGSAAKAGIPDQIIAQMIRIFSWSVDFQRDIRSGDEIDILYEVVQTEDGNIIGYGDIKYARLVNRHNDIALYRYKNDDGRIQYYDQNGRSSRKTLMKTPVDGARISSSYGMRHHPVLGYSKMHKGIDFAAPRGTPIYAAGDGVIEKAGRWGSFGNYIRIRHNSTLKTAYAHLQKFNTGIRPGVRVKQGDVIGYIGTTGRSTGPHLHYEVQMNGTQVNPNGINVPIGEELKHAELKKFNAEMQRYKNEFASLTKSQNYAQAESADLNN